MLDTLTHFLSSVEGGITALLSTLLSAAVAGAVKGWRESKRKDADVQRAYESSRPTANVMDDEPVTKKLPAIPDDKSVEAALWWQTRAIEAQDQLTIERAARTEAARLGDARERALETKNRELQLELDRARADLVVATNARVKAERAGLDLMKQWERSKDMDSDAPPPEPRTPGAQGAKTVPPKR